MPKIDLSIGDAIIVNDNRWRVTAINNKDREPHVIASAIDPEQFGAISMSAVFGLNILQRAGYVK